jgi:hypothetical protein
MYWQSLWFGSPAADSSVRGTLFISAISKERSMPATLKYAQHDPSVAAAAKAERERDKAQAVRDYEAEQLARQANMARLRALRLAKESADARAAKPRRPAKKKAAS